MLRKVLRGVAAFWFYVLAFCLVYWMLNLAFGNLANAFIDPHFCFFNYPKGIPYAICPGLRVGQGMQHLLGAPISILLLPVALLQFRYWHPAALFILGLHALAIAYAINRFGAGKHRAPFAFLFGERRSLEDP